MKNLLAFLAAAVLVFVGVGWYLNWFPVTSAPAASGHQAYNVDVNVNKMVSDIEKGGAKAIDLAEKARQEVEASKAAAAKKDAANAANMEPKKPEMGKSGK